MIIDYTQNKDTVDISFVNNKKQIELLSAPLTFGYYNYVKAESYDIGIIQDLTSFKQGSLIKREPSKYFTKHNINEFFNYELKNYQPSVYEKIMQLNIPDPFSVDIETDITDETGYSTAEKAENKILSISITDSSLNTIIFALKNSKKVIFSDNDKIAIDNMIKESLGEYSNLYDFNFEIRVFDTEVEMINVFLECINKYFHSIIGWNFTLYDWRYIFNRCKRLGIDIKKASPSNKITKKSFSMKDGSEVKLDMPSHRVIGDYMTLFQTSLLYNNLGSYSLNDISGMILGLKKVMYEGNLRTLYNENYNKFIAYAIIDTILVMLIHIKTNLYGIDFFEAYFNKIAFLKISQNNISEALVYNNLRKNNKFLLESEFNSEQKRPFQGGYVKTPTKKIIQAGAGIDFSGLYPNSIITNGISPEKKIDKIQTVNGRPKTQQDLDKWLKYKAMGFTLTPNGVIYDTNEDGLFVTIEKELIAQRGVYKGYANEIYINLTAQIDKQLEKFK